MPAKDISINLLGESAMDHTPLGRIVTWAVTYGRYIMIGTEIVVLLAFISRFSLDRKLTDLKEEVSQKQDIIEANIDLENQVRTLQDQLVKIKTLVAISPSDPFVLLNTFQNIIPPDVSLNMLSLENGKLTADVIAQSTNGFAQFIANLQSTTALRQVQIGDITRTPLHGIQFSLSALYSTAPVPKKLAPVAGAINSTGEGQQ